MPALAFEKSYVELQNKVKNLLARALQTHTISIEELMAILTIFEKTETHAELEAFIEIFAEAFPILQQFEQEKRESSKSDLETKMKNVVSVMIKKDPLKATQIAKAALKPGMTWEALKEEFPEIEE